MIGRLNARNRATYIDTCQHKMAKSWLNTHTLDIQQPHGEGGGFPKGPHGIRAHPRWLKSRFTVQPFDASRRSERRLVGTHMNGHYAAVEVPPLAEAYSWELFGVRGAAREHTDASHELNRTDRSDRSERPPGRQVASGRQWSPVVARSPGRQVANSCQRLP